MRWPHPAPAPQSEPTIPQRRAQRLTSDANPHPDRNPLVKRSGAAVFLCARSGSGSATLAWNFPKNHGPRGLAAGALFSREDRIPFPHLVLGRLPREFEDERDPFGNLAFEGADRQPVGGRDLGLSCVDVSHG